MSDVRSINSLTDLATKIKDCHRAVIESGRTTVRKAIDAGIALIEAKQHPQVGHGKWLSWLRDNCGFSERTAEVYMTLARNRGRLDAIIATAADMTLSEALKAIKPRPHKSEAGGSVGKYEKAQAKLIERLMELPTAEDVEEAAQRTITELSEIIGGLKKRAA